MTVAALRRRRFTAGIIAVKSREPGTPTLALSKEEKKRIHIPF